MSQRKTRDRRSPRPAQADYGRIILAVFGLLIACSICFVAGAAAEFFVPPSYLEVLVGVRPVPGRSQTVLAHRPVMRSLLQAALSVFVPRETILVLGSDLSYSKGRVDPKAPTRSDTLLLVGVSVQGLEILSIPRDTVCPIPGHGRDRVNAALAFGGPRLALQAVANFLHVPIDHWVLLHLNGLVDLVNAIGGVDLDVPEPMHYVDHTAHLHINLSRGMQHLDGEQAHEFIRFRHDPQGDIGRVARQQLFLKAVAAKLLSPAGLIALPRLVQAFPHDVETDLHTGQIAALAAWGRTLDPSRIHTETLPGAFGPGGTWTVDPRRAARIAARLFGRPMIPVGPSTPAAERLATNIAVLNGTSRQGLANEAAQILRASGWTVWEVGNADRLTYRTSEILCRTHQSSEAGAMANALGLSPRVLPASSAPRQPDGESAEVDYIVILGQDFLNALRVPVETGPA